MREPSMRIRSLALVLVLVCAGALSYEMRPFPCGSAGQASLIPQVVTTTAAIPAPSGTSAAEHGAGFSPDPIRPVHGARSAEAPRRSISARLPQPRIAPPSTWGMALLGLPFPPANAPPRV